MEVLSHGCPKEGPAVKPVLQMLFAQQSQHHWGSILIIKDKAVDFQTGNIISTTTTITITIIVMIWATYIIHEKDAEKVFPGWSFDGVSSRNSRGALGILGT